MKTSRVKYDSFLPPWYVVLLPVGLALGIIGGVFYLFDLIFFKNTKRLTYSKNKFSK